MRLIIYILLVVIFTTSCVKKYLHDPGMSELVIKINWDNLEVTDSVTIKIAGESIIVYPGQQPDTILVESGHHELFVFNIPAGISIRDEMAIIQKDNNEHIISNPGTFYSAFQNIIVGANSISEIEITPVRRMRLLSVKLIGFYNDTVQSTHGSLTNVATSFNMKTCKEEISGSVALNFSHDSCAIVNLLGVIGNTQILKLNSINADIDVSAYLTDFNSDKTEPKEIIIRR